MCVAMVNGSLGKICENKIKPYVVFVIRRLRGVNVVHRVSCLQHTFHSYCSLLCIYSRLCIYLYLYPPNTTPINAERCAYKKSMEHCAVAYLMRFAQHKRPGDMIMIRVESSSSSSLPVSELSRLLSCDDPTSQQQCMCGDLSLEDGCFNP